MHPAFIGSHYPFSVATGPSPSITATAVTFPAIPVPSMTQIAYPYHSDTSLPINTTVAGQDILGLCFCVLCTHLRKVPFILTTSILHIYFVVGSIHAGSTLQAIQGSSVSSQPSALASTSYTVDEEHHHQPISQQGMHYLHSAYRVGENRF